MTIDVECFSIQLNRCDPSIGKDVYDVGLPLLLDILAKYDIKGTFYFTGKMAKMFPESVKLVREYNHEVGCHGYSHSPEKAFDVLSYDEQVAELVRAKKTIEKVAGRIQSFRAPALRINEDTVKALEYTGFTSDSSICSQRFDGPFTFGSKKKLKWLIAPRRPYFLSYESIIKSGKSKILEIPVSALFIPYIGTTMRISPNLIKILQKLLFFESKKTYKPVVFLFHPNECLGEGTKITTTRRAKNLFEYFFADVLRQRLKLRNLGIKALKLLDEILKEACKQEFEFITVSEFRRFWRRYMNVGSV